MFVVNKRVKRCIKTTNCHSHVLKNDLKISVDGCGGDGNSNKEDVEGKFCTHFTDMK